MERAITRLQQTSLGADPALHAICDRYRGWAGIGPVPSHWRWTQVVLDLNYLLNTIATLAEQAPHELTPDEYCACGHAQGLHWRPGAQCAVPQCACTGFITSRPVTPA